MLMFLGHDVFLPKNVWFNKTEGAAGAPRNRRSLQSRTIISDERLDCSSLRDGAAAHQAIGSYSA